MSGSDPAVREPRRGHVFVIAAPSGTGKTTICRRILASDPRLVVSVSHTTRAPRKGERDGVDYHFVDDRSFRRLVEQQAFLEHAEYNGRQYGTSFRAIEEPLAAGRDVVLEIEVQGAAQVRERLPDACLIFLLPPNLEVLEARLRGRGTDEESVIQKRMALVDRELAAARIFDYAIVNDDLERAVADVLEVIGAVRRGETEGGITERFGRAGVMARWRG
ncbi:MAG: guanylate kinase [Spirochaetaceae bacterium]|nr:guanylate kinase [Myxococcales bacterium]MCB9723505.1 guanylate kinase [Spirochaetaceae bacterium]